jgi:hypothetical protein
MSQVMFSNLSLRFLWSFSSQPIVILQNMFDLEARKYLWFSGGGKAWSVCLLAQQEVTLSTTTTTTTLHIYYYFYHYKFTVY